MTIRSQMNLIMGLIGREQRELFALEFKIKSAIFDFVYSVASTIFNQSALNLAIIYITIKSWLSVIKSLIRLDRLDLFALESEKMLHLTLSTL